MFTTALLESTHIAKQSLGSGTRMSIFNILLQFKYTNSHLDHWYLPRSKYAQDLLFRKEI